MTWHVNPQEDNEARRIVIGLIVSYLESHQRRADMMNGAQKTPEQVAKDNEKIVQLSRQLEVMLYKSSKTKEEYMNTDTLSQRIRELKRSSSSASGSSSSSSTAKSTSTSGSASVNGIAGSNPAASVSNGHKSGNIPGTPTDATAIAQGNQLNAPPPKFETPDNSLSLNPALMQQQVAAGLAAVPNIAAGTATNVAATAPNATQQPTPEQMEKTREYIIKQRQQRLLLLRHASKCTVADGKCETTPHCAAMKQLWAHIAKCKDQDCKTAHCVSSRCVLSHYHRCKLPDCEVCKPVRELSQQQKLKQQMQMNKMAGVDSNGQPSVPGASQPSMSRNASTQEILPNGVIVNASSRPNGNQIVVARPVIGLGVSKSAASANQAAAAVASASLLASASNPAVDPQIISNRRENQEMLSRIASSSANLLFARGSLDGTGPSLPLSMTAPLIESHLRSLKTERIQQVFGSLLRKLVEHKYNKGVFNEPVDADELGIPEYKEIVKKPMDLGTIRRKLEDGKYNEPEDFLADCQLVFKNAITFHPKGHAIHDSAQFLLKFLDAEYAKTLPLYTRDPTKRNKKEECQLCKTDECEICPLCNRGCITFEPKMLYCAGTCNGRIARNAFYYTVQGSTYVWCEQCNDKVKDPYFEENGVRFSRSNLIKKKNNELIGEPWVSCDICEEWVHQVCALFNSRKNDPNDPQKYICPNCLLKQEKEGQQKSTKVKIDRSTLSAASSNKRPTMTPSTAATTSASSSPAVGSPAASGTDPNEPTSKRRRIAKTKYDPSDNSATPIVTSLKPSEAIVPSSSSSSTTAAGASTTYDINSYKLPRGKKVPYAEELPHTRLSSFLERWVRDRLTTLREKERLNPPSIVGDPGPPPESIRVRVVSNMKTEATVKPHFSKVDGFTAKIPYNSQCIFLFQALDGVDVLLFVMYVQEYGSDSVGANKRKLYIAYLDSVHFLRPRHHRTFVYHELLLGYLEYSRRNGYESAYIWACPPPNKRDDYILHVHPEDQRVPSSDRLRKWYHDMIKRGVDDNIILSSCVLYEEHFEASLKPLSRNSRSVAKRKLTAKKNKAIKSGSSKGKSSSQKMGSKNPRKSKGVGSSLLPTLSSQSEKMDVEESSASATTKNQNQDASQLNNTNTSMMETDNNGLDETMDGNNDDQEKDGQGDESLLEDMPDIPQGGDDEEDSEDGNVDGAGNANGNDNANAMDTSNPTGDSSSASSAAAKSIFLEVGKGLRAGGDHMLPQDLEKRKENKLAFKLLMPYFDGDYWPQEAEALCEEMSQKRKQELGITDPAPNALKGPARNSVTGALSYRKRKRGEEDPNNPNATTGNDSNAPASSPKASGSPAPSSASSSNALEPFKVDTSIVFGRIGNQLEAMREDFLVVKLAHECTRCGKFLLRGRWECRHPFCQTRRGFNQSAPFAICNKCYKEERARPADQQHGGGCIQSGVEGEPKSEEVEEAKELGKDQTPIDEVGNEQESDAAKKDENGQKKISMDERRSEMEKKKKETETWVASKIDEWNALPLGSVRSLPPAVSPSSPTNSKGANGDDGKDEAESEEKSKQTSAEREILNCGTGHELYYVDENLPIVTPKYDRTIKNPLLDTRHAFLSLCTANRYQFDQLRRAKYSTMMVLYHLHNPDAPAHLFTCNECQKDIVSGYRFNCTICSAGDFDLCYDCVKKTNHDHRLVPIAVTQGVDVDSNESKRRLQSDDKRRARQRSLEMYLEALVHASSCKSVSCSPHCMKMKELLAHRIKCTVRVRNGCEVCKRVLLLVQMHAKNCQIKNCPVPHCEDLKAHLRQQSSESAQKAQAQQAFIRAQQQQMIGAAAPGAIVTGTNPSVIPTGTVISGAVVKTEDGSGSADSDLKIKIKRR